jgi:hypothetical protein
MPCVHHRAPGRCSAARAEYIPEIGAFAQYVYQDGAPFQVGSMFFTLIVLPVLYVVIHQRGSRPGPGPVVAAALLALSCGIGVRAQSRSITLDEAVSPATKHNATVTIAGERVKQTDARIRSKGELLPIAYQRFQCRPHRPPAAHRDPAGCSRRVSPDWAAAGSGSIVGAG